MDFLTHSYIDASYNHTTPIFNAEAIDLDRKRDILYTTAGELHYDYLVFALGIEYDYRIDGWRG